MRLHFISGLPRSGSTLLGAILRQNPEITAGMTSPVSSLYSAMESAMARRNENAVWITDDQRIEILRGVFHGYYKDRSGIVFDTSRFWTHRLTALSKLFPEAKIICCVRDLSWIIDSFERLYRRNAFEPSGVYNYSTDTTIYSRAAIVSGSGGVVGFALDGLREALSGEQKDKVLLVEYEHLCKSPDAAVARIYDFIGEPKFAHDFDHVEYSASEFDRNIGARGLHDVNGAVRWTPRETILPDNLFASYVNDQFWRNPLKLVAA
jgi:sulfotransferase